MAVRGPSILLQGPTAHLTCPLCMAAALQVYHTKRMQRVFCVRFSGDGSYVFSGSDDMNVRVWKADASEQLGVTLPREKHKAAYNKALVSRYKHLPEVKRIVRHRNVPSAIHKVGAAAGICSCFVGLRIC